MAQRSTTMHRRPRQRPRLGAVLVAAVGVAASLLAFFLSRDAEATRIRHQFEMEAQERIIVVDRTLQGELDRVMGLGAFFSASEQVERGEFRVFARTLLKEHRGIQAFEWVPRVRDAERDAYERASEKDTLLQFYDLGKFQITERKAEGGMIRAGRRAEYLPVHYVEPYAGNASALGFDLGSDRVRHQSLCRARDTGALSITSRVTLVQERGTQFGILAFVPVYRRGASVETVEERRENLEGFALGVFRVGDILDYALADLVKDAVPVDMHLFDESAPAGERCLYAGEHGVAVGEAEGEEDEAEAAGVRRAEHVSVGDRRWLVLCTPADGWLESQRSWLPWGVLAGGLLIAWLFTRRVTRQAQETRELWEGEERYRQLAQQLEEKEWQNRAILDNIPDMAWLKDRESRFVAVNGPLARACGRIPQELIGLTDLDIWPRELAERFRADDAEVMRTKQPKKVEEPSLTADGRRGWTETVKTPVLDALGEVTGTAGIARDITERRDTEAKLDELHKQLLLASRQAGMAEVATGVLHNVGNVLNSVNVSATLVADKLHQSRVADVGRVAGLLREHQADLAAFTASNPHGRHLGAYLTTLAEHLAGEQTVLLKEIRSLGENVDHIKDIINTQQVYAAMAGVVEPVAPAELVEDALRLNAAAFSRHDVRVVREYAPVPVVTLEKHKLLQILVNLLRNAKYALDDGAPPEKRLTVRIGTCGQERFTISVKDNGVGIPPEHLTRIFSHGFTTRKGGHGFGLHSAALAAKELGGTLTVQSAGLGTGAEFVVELPLVAGAARNGMQRVTAALASVESVRTAAAMEARP